MINLNGTEVGILKCTGNNDGYSWWTVEGIYPVYYRGGHDGFYIIDNEGDKRSGTSIQDIIDLLTESGVTLELVLEQPSPESVKTEGSMKVVCKATPRPNWWTVGKVYEVHTSKHRLYLLDDEGDNRYREDLSEILDNTKNDYTTFELVEESCPKMLNTVAQVKAKIKAAQEVANKAYEEIGRLEADLEVLEKYV